jgi:phosphoinositide-3-kinase regulatory subunit 4
MGNQLSLITPSSTTFAIDAYVAELKTIHYEKNLGNARFLKTIRGLNDEGPVVVKVFIKPTLDLDLSVYYAELLSKYLINTFKLVLSAILIKYY